MREIDAKPTDYRRENPETGAMEYPVNRSLLKVMVGVGIALYALLLWVFARDGIPLLFAIVPSVVSALTAMAFTILLRRLNW